MPCRSRNAASYSISYPPESPEETHSGALHETKTIEEEKFTSMFMKRCSISPDLSIVPLSKGT